MFGRAVIMKEADAQYTLLIYQKADDAVDEDIVSAAPNLTLASAFNLARDALAGLAVSGLTHKIVTISTKLV